MPRPGEWAFLAPVGDVGDWRVVVSLDAMQRAGLLDELPCCIEARAAALGLSVDACRRLARVARRAGLVDLDESTDVLDRGASFPDAMALDQIAQHANAIRQWSSQIDDRVRGLQPADNAARFNRVGWLRSMASGAIPIAGSIAERVLSAAPKARNVLELGGGHGEYGRAFARLGCRVTMLDTEEIVSIVRSEGWLNDDVIDLVVGDFHAALPDGPFDVVLCFGINHTFGADKNAALFHRIAAVLATDGIVAISTTLAGTGERAELFAVHMLANRSGGNTHDEGAYRRWVDDAGLEIVSLERIGDDGRALLLATRRASPGRS